MTELLATGDEVRRLRERMLPRLIVLPAASRHPLICVCFCYRLVCKFLQDARRYPAALLTVLQRLTDIRVLQYALTLIEDFLSVDTTNRARYFTEAAVRAAGAGPKYAMYLPFLQLIGVSGTGAVISALDANTYVVERAATCIALLVVASAEADPAATAGILSWSMTHIRNYGAPNAKQAKVTEVAMSTLRVLLRLGMMRELFVAERGVESLLPPLSARNTQLLYDTVFCLWALSLDKDIAPHLERTGAVAGVARLARPTMPLKVLRMSLAMLANCLRVADASDALSEIVESHVPETVDALLAQDPKISDPELVRCRCCVITMPAYTFMPLTPARTGQCEAHTAVYGVSAYLCSASPDNLPLCLQLDDLRFLKETVRTGRRKLSSLERYERDLHARRFEWTMVHSSDFWKENATAFEADGFKLIERVRDLLADPEGTVDETTQAVALFDLGEFAVQHPQGRT